MNFETVKSSQIHSLAHSGDSKEMHVRFRCGRCEGSGSSPGGDFGCPKCGGSGVSSAYRYFDVPAHVHEAVKGADSVGASFHALIKKGNYRYEKVSQ